MESTGEKSVLLHQILPPRLEDAGLEDPALPPESIHQAFLQAAAAVKSRAASIFSSDEGASDAVVGIEPENEPPGPCVVEKGSQLVPGDVKVGGGGGVEEVGDDDAVVVVGEEGVKLGEDGGACVDGLQGLDIKEKEVLKEQEDDDGDKKPTLVEGYV